MDIPKAVAERAMWSLTESAKELVEANPLEFMKPVLSHFNALKRIRDRGVNVETVVDLGAARGSWSKMARTVWPNSRCHMIEANHSWERELHDLTTDPAYSYVIAAAGPKRGEGHFKFSKDPYGGVARTEKEEGTSRVPMTTVDSECAEHGLQTPILLKFDTHGFEREILEGASETLKKTSLIVIEAYNFGKREKRFPAMLDSLEDLGFRCIDIGEPLFRDYDHSFWQIDFFLVPLDRPEFEYGGYK
ncbi:MAG: methyltransferase FkbM family protein [Candidatus Marinimicrobia bacterium]|nr:methyltransferase FkbM family protein [Candidatus Neomarinimicrobiota bacterium]